MFIYLWDFCSQVLILLWIFQEIHKFHDLQLGLLAASHIFKLHVDLILEDLGGRLSDTEESAHAPARAADPGWAPPDGIEQEGNDEHGGQHAQEEGAADTRQRN